MFKSLKINMSSFVIQKVLPALTVVLRNLSDSTDLKAILSKKIPEEQERVKNFRKTYGPTKIGEVTVDMVSVTHIFSNYFSACVCLMNICSIPCLLLFRFI